MAITQLPILLSDDGFGQPAQGFNFQQNRG